MPLILYHGFSRGSALSFQIALMDRGNDGMGFFSSFISDSGGGFAETGGEIPGYIQNAPADAYQGAHFWLYCGGKDHNGRTCQDMDRMEKIIPTLSGTVDELYKYDPGGHGIFITAENGGKSPALQALIEYIQGIKATQSNPSQTVQSNAQFNDTNLLLAYFRDLPNRDENRVISGQMIGQGEGALIGYEQRVEALHESTGKWVGLIGVDYGFGKYTYDSWDLTSANQLIIDYWNQGGLVTISWAARNPWTDDPASDTESADLVELITLGREINEIWMTKLDHIAAALTELRDAGVVVLWRPFHEMNGEWFWWGSSTHPHDPQPFIDMWQHMHDYFTHEKGLDNLIWVYSASQRQRPPADFYYPGDDYVDIVGEDSYSATVELNGYERLTTLGKPYALTEFGPRQAADGSYNYTTLIHAIREKYPLVTYWLSWNNTPDKIYSLVGNQNADELLNDPWVLTREELDWR